ncbi:hypothetical protein AB0P07_13580 [Streptomyces sp. NPDC085944]|uniref:hypothetical protein n=1 Tax=Streptomyces sp. NPDC085944 TaxID=3154962 RepID=UPI00342808D4
MSLPLPLRLLSLFLLAFVGGVLYLHFGKEEEWSSSLLVGLVAAPLVVALWKFRHWSTDRAAEAGRNRRKAREERRRASGA